MILPLQLANLLISAITFVGITSAANLEESVSTTANPVINPYICPTSDFELVKGQCRGLAQTFLLEDISKALYTAIDTCTALNAILPIVRNSEDHTYWNVKSIGTVILIGIVCDVKSKKWMWIDGTEITFKPEVYDDMLNDSCTTWPPNSVWYYGAGAGGWFYYGPGGVFITSKVYCIANLKTPEIQDDDCVQFDDDDSDSMCYQVSDNAESWSDAQNTCRSVGANLASIHNSQENSFIRRLAVSKGLVNGVMLGAEFDGTSGTFEWTDGSEWDYSNFQQGFPIAGLGDCLLMSTGDSKGEWSNTDCTSTLPFACSRKPFTDSPPNVCLGSDIKEGDIVRTPGFPTDASTNCDFILEVGAGKLVEIEVLLVEANNCCDHFVLYEINNGDTIIAKNKQIVQPQKFRTTSSNKMRASWQPNGGVNVRGAMFTFRGV